MSSLQASNIPVSNVGISTAPTVQAPVARKKTISPQQLQRECIDLIKTQNSNISDLSNALWNRRAFKSSADFPPLGTRIDFTKIDDDKLTPIGVKIKKFQSTYPNTIKLLNTTSWAELKKILKDDMKNPVTDKTIIINNQKQAIKLDGISLETFRDKAVAFQKELLMDGSRMVDLPQVTASASGTVGYNSDIDLVLAPSSSEASETDQILAKLFIDTAWTYSVGGLSGTQVDLETYLVHVGASRNTAQLIDTPLAKQKYCRLELMLSNLDKRASLGTDIEAWKTYTKDFKKKLMALESPSAKQHLVATEQIFQEVEELYTKISQDIMRQTVKEYEASMGVKSPVQNLQNASQMDLKHSSEKDSKEFNALGLDIISSTEMEAVEKKYKEICAKDPEAPKRATALFKASRLISLSEQMDAIKNEINIAKKNYDAYKVDSRNPKANEEKLSLKSMLDELEVKLATIAGLRYFFFDESYLTQAALNKTCETEGGQISQKRDENIGELIEKNRLAASVQDFHVISRTTKRAPTPQENLLSTRENLSKGQAKMAKYKNDFEHGLIESSKYAERTASGCKITVEALAESLARKGIRNATVDQLVARATDMHYKTQELEKVKRKFVLNLESTAKLLSQRITPPGEDVDKTTIAIKKFISAFEINHQFSDETVSKTMKFNALVRSMEHFNIRDPQQTKLENDFKARRDSKSIFMKVLPQQSKEMSQMSVPVSVELDSTSSKKSTGQTNERDIDQFRTTGDKEIDSILKARAGFDRVNSDGIVNKEIDSHHKEAEHITLESLQLTKPSQIIQFNRELQDLSDEILFASIEHGLLPPPAPYNPHQTTPVATMLDFWQATERS